MAKRQSHPRPFTIDDIDAFNAARRTIRENLTLLIFVLDHPDKEHPIAAGTDLLHSLTELAISGADALIRLDEIVQRAWQGGAR